MSERKSSRAKKVVDYATFGDEDGGSDDDFATPTPPPSKKTKLSTKESKPKKTQNIEASAKKSKKRRTAVEERVFDKELQLALELSMSETQLPPPLETSTQIPKDEGKKECNKENAGQNAAQMPDLDAIEELGSVEIKDDDTKPRAKRKAAADANKKRKLMSDDEEEEEEDQEDETSKQKGVVTDCDDDFSIDKELKGKESEDEEDEDFDMEDEEDSDYEIEKTKVTKGKKGKTPKKETQKQGKDSAKLKSKEVSATNRKCASKITTKKAAGTIASPSVTRAPLAVSRTPSAVSRSSLSSPGVGAPKWKPPALLKSGTSPSASTCGNGMISPTGLRLGLSRNIRVSKPLHSNIKVHQ
ncbi:nuclear ubiquitous casein and cyclin-dependent kinase substrate 1 isoform X2 [Lingula anatina]|uniref:Nuclear ubiquitous casein and cyclin-dependent kinase substrate 1 isoform X1 n=1 Tax=Lingula anatina TaxID=7574 RepID=A0A1S3IG63_LINAN|nr:nuclear ubiquitous casein and cyclin-dependent kinase substrate 1 isoform X1 [Lingula anatina]XP_013397258.1 nuclear ubiquitous casein and cyclin-dependent kinase substrate 1 isoform X2 [Lingula anatina]|eukprot:XP_013397250.1 nuclear ubiquitous casein and cyclin-dependent kinase substrate 1 isoform X1 [Lingula anatina]